jgi:uncharacterized membrane protein YfcA
VQSVDAIALIGGVVAGFLGALLGIGGGVFLVPLFNGLLGMSFAEARGISLVGVLGTSASAAMGNPGKRLLNPRLAIFLLLFSVTGASIGAMIVDAKAFPDRVYELLFGGSMAMVALLMLARRNVRNVLPPETRDVGFLGGRIHDDDSGADVAYRVRRLPVATGVSFFAGALASLIGIGGGVVIVPALNTLCGVPIRVAAATSVLMIGVTTIPGVAASWHNGYLGDYYLAALTSVGALAGFQVGLHVSPRFQVKWLKVGMACLLSAVSIQYLFLR